MSRGIGRHTGCAFPLAQGLVAGRADDPARIPTVAKLPAAGHTMLEAFKFSSNCFVLW